MKLKETYKNRYKDVFTFHYDSEEDPNKILWCGDFQYVRYSWENDLKPEDNKFCMVDPSGGPYISSGLESNFIIKDLKGMYVDYLSMNGEDADKPQSINIYLKPLNS